MVIPMHFGSMVGTEAFIARARQVDRAQTRQ
jgi:hypothetical protein